MTYRDDCDCRWCANLDAKPCVAIEDLQARVAALEAGITELATVVKAIAPTYR